MTKPMRVTLTILTLIALLIGIGIPVIAGSSPKTTMDLDPKQVMLKSDKQGDPWDPGDEFVPVPAEKSSGIKAPKDFLFKSKIAPKGEDPWDPGDEGPNDNGGRS